MKRTILALLMAAALLLTGCALVEKDEAVDAARTIIKVGEDTFTKAEVQSNVDYQLSYTQYLYSMYGYPYDVTDEANIAEIQDTVIDGMVEDAVLNQQVKAQNVTLTEEQQAELDKDIEDTWNDQLENVKDTYFGDTELEGEELDAAVAAKMDELGFTKDTLVETETQAHLRDALEEKIKSAVAEPTEEELTAKMAEQVQADKDVFESNPNAYGTRWNGNTVTLYYRPAGYRLVKQILVKFTDEDQAVLDDLNDKILDQETAITTLRQGLTEAGVEDIDALLAQVNVTLEKGENLATPTDLSDSFDETVDEETAGLARQLAEANALQGYYQEQLDAAKDVAFQHIDATADEVLAKIEAGEDWDALAEQYNQDPGMQGDTRAATHGYAVREGFLSFDAAFVDAAMALEKIGDTSGKVRGGSNGYYIIRYNEDVAEGEVAMDDVRETLVNDIMDEKKTEAWDASVQAWKDATEITIDKNALND